MFSLPSGNGGAAPGVVQGESGRSRCGPTPLKGRGRNAEEPRSGQPTGSCASSWEMVGSELAGTPARVVPSTGRADVGRTVRTLFRAGTVVEALLLPLTDTNMAPTSGRLAAGTERRTCVASGITVDGIACSPRPMTGICVVGVADNSVPTSDRLEVGRAASSWLTIGIPVEDSPVVLRLTVPLPEVDVPSRPPPRRPESRPVVVVSNPLRRLLPGASREARIVRSPAGRVPSTCPRVPTWAGVRVLSSWVSVGTAPTGRPDRSCPTLVRLPTGTAPSSRPASGMLVAGTPFRRAATSGTFPAGSTPMSEPTAGSLSAGTAASSWPISWRSAAESEPRSFETSGTEAAGTLRSRSPSTGTASASVLKVAVPEVVPPEVVTDAVPPLVVVGEEAVVVAAPDSVVLPDVAVPDNVVVSPDPVDTDPEASGLASDTSAVGSAVVVVVLF